jgi:glutamyl-tRNA reductase
VEHLLLLGLSYNEAPAEVREAVAIPSSDLPAALAATRPYLSQAVILSTCARTEIYGVANSIGSGFEAIGRFLRQWRGRQPDELASAYRKVDEQAVRHLFRLASGLESTIVGESQILGQIRRAFEAALANDTAGAGVARLLRQALQAGKRARTETGIGHAAASLGGIAAEIAAAHLQRIDGGRTLIVGAGEMGKLTAAAVAAQQLGEVVIIGRDLKRARLLANKLGASAGPFRQLAAELTRADVVVSATSSPQPVISREMLKAARRGYAPRPLVLVDLALPRDIERAAGSLPEVQLYDVDAMQALAAEHVQDRQRFVPPVEAIIAQEVGEYMAWWNARRLAPAITELAIAAEAIARTETAKARRKLPDLRTEQWTLVEALASSVAGKLLHASIEALKSGADNANKVGTL